MRLASSQSKSILRVELTLRWCLVPLFMMVPGVRYWKRISSLIGTSVGVVMVGRLEAGEVGRILKCGSPCLRVARREARRSRVEFLLLLLRNSIFKLLSKVLTDFSISCCRLAKEWRRVVGGRNRSIVGWGWGHRCEGRRVE